MEFDPKHGEGQQPMLLSDMCLKPFEGTTPSPSSKEYYLQDFDHLDHDHEIHVDGSSSSNPVFVYDSFPNNVDFYECKPFAAAADDGQVMDSVGLVNMCHQTFDFAVADESAENGYCNKSRALANWKGRKKSNGVKGQWTMEEDRVLIRLVEQYGLRKWSHIAQMLPGRIGKQCRERWHNHLRPDIKKDTWSEEEDKVLIQAHIEIGNKWAEIAKRLPGRTENSIKNHWNATKRRQFSKRKCRSKYPRGSILQEYIKSLNLESKATADKSSAQAMDFWGGSERLVPEYEFSFDERLLQESCSIDSLLDQIPTAPMAMTEEVKKEMDLVEMISAHPNIS
ncbi:hypothetical protein HRI_003615500 [Hibiscus trionum]|uniref:Uncharacterized protein n=1 Tax=Hibiscus trionum TaxID=183268 RepID=A0A9W7IMU5_HIBTR|nr:hypothetical protein HRI_003615500 [Hibiscus trionum]